MYLKKYLNALEFELNPCAVLINSDNRFTSFHSSLL